MKPSIAKTLAALAQAGRPRVAGEARVSLFASAASTGGPDGGTHQGASPNIAGAAAAEAIDIVDKLNAERGLRPGPNPGGPRTAPVAGPADHGGDDLSPAALAAAVNGENARTPGFVEPDPVSARRSAR